jgi:cell fate (sporulation/competence/biofilm development) regulator YlbF (YheA/YmcA/DUF963 family)
MDEKLRQAANEFGKVLAETPAVEAYCQAAAEMDTDGKALRLKTELGLTYDELLQRQASGQVTRGEIDAYYELEQRVRDNPLLARHEASLELLKDTFSEVHYLLSAQLGINFKDLVD